jgi:adenylate cyclase, class 2
VPIEHEAKVLGINPETVTACILAVGGEQVSGPRLMRRHVYDIVPGAMSKWICLLELLRFKPKSYQENKRTSFTLSNARLELDEWPLIPPYLEIEADTKSDVL